MQTANLKVCGGEMVVSVLAVQQVTTGTPEHVGSPFPILQGILDWEEYGIYLDNIEEFAYIHCISDGYCICRYDSLIYLSSLRGELWKLWQINFLFHHQVPQIDCKRKVYWRPKPRSMEKGSELIGTRLWRHPVLDQMIGGRVMSCPETGKARRGELKHLKVLLLSSHLKWVEVTCCACVNRLKVGSQTQLSVRTWNHKITRHHWNGWIGIFTSCILALPEFLCFANWSHDIEVVLIA